MAPHARSLVLHAHSIAHVADQAVDRGLRIAGSALSGALPTRVPHRVRGHQTGRVESFAPDHSQRRRTLVMAAAAFGLGLEHVVDAYGCDEAALRSQIVLQRLLSRIIEDLHLRVIGDPAWHVFPEPAGLTGLVMLTESHLSVHTFPESQYAAMNLYCCRQT